MSADDLALGTAVARAQDGDEAAFAVLYRLVQPGLLGYLRGTVSEGAEDVAAAAWREIARELPRFRGDGHGFRGWTASIARRHARGHLRRRGASPHSAKSPWAPATGDQIAHALPGATLSAETARALIAHLPCAQAEAILLHHVVRLEESAVARVMGRPSAVVRFLARRGVRNLARWLGPDDVAHDVARTLGGTEMSTRRNGDEPLSGEAHHPEAAPRSGHTSERDEASGLDSTADRIGEALRQQPVDDHAEQSALAAFRSARTAVDGALRTRRRDDWRPRPRTQRWARGGALTLVTSTLLGGIAFASIGVMDSGQHHAPQAGTSDSTRRPPAPTPGEQDSPSTGSGTPPTASTPLPGTAKDVQAHCRVYEKVKDRGHALNATAWQRLVRAAGGEQQVASYCAQLTGAAQEATPAPTKTNKAEKPGKTGENGKGQGKPSAEAKPSKAPSNRP
ncbi:RNA polymerase sigma factor [Streptomyces sp. NPDC048581]|uniref:RNA polymerase sigma factor n=1 Tax=Streptomyces sp. NPDC048581 TaxID=3365572 RepID=UPI0037193CD5